MVSPAKFWNWNARRYAKQPVRDEAAYQKKLETTRTYLSPNSEVFEFGCGTGTTAIHHAPHVKHILAVDISATMLEIAREKAAAAGVDNITFEEAAIDDYAVVEQRFDVVLGMSILHLLDDKEAAIARAFSMLKPGGYLITSTVCIAQLNGLAILKSVVRLGAAVGLLPTVKAFEADQLVDSIENAGFELEQRWEPSGGVLFAVARKPT